MVDLVASGPFDRLLPLTVGTVSLVAEDVADAVEIAPFPGQEGAVAGIFEEATGLSYPVPGGATHWRDGTPRAAWTGRGRVLLAGSPPVAGLDGLAAQRRQGDGIAAAVLSGADDGAVLARLVPLDVGTLDPGTAVRTLAGHIAVTLIRSAEGWTILAPRSMAGTLVHDLRRAMGHVAGRRALPRG